MMALPIALSNLGPCLSLKAVINFAEVVAASAGVFPFDCEKPLQVDLDDECEKDKAWLEKEAMPVPQLKAAQRALVILAPVPEHLVCLGHGATLARDAFHPCPNVVRYTF